MRHLVPRATLWLGLLCAASALWAAGATAQPGSGPRQTVNQRFTTTRPGSPTGVSYTASYHAAGDEQGRPPYMRRVVIHPPRGMRYDTSVPERCTASDAELQVMGPAACPAGSRLGDGTAEGLVLMPFADDVVLDHFTHPVHVLNNENEQIVLVESEGFTVVRGAIRPNGSIVWEPTTCFPTNPATDCVDDHIIQFGTSTVLPPYTRTVDGRVRSYATTPPNCPERGYWRTTARFRWSDGSADRVVTRQPCRRQS